MLKGTNRMGLQTEAYRDRVGGGWEGPVRNEMGGEDEPASISVS